MKRAVLLPPLLALGLLALCWLEASQAEPAYQSSGWRPQGQSLNPCYLPPTTTTTTTKMRTTSKRPPSRSRESTTPRSNDDENDVEEAANDEQQSRSVAVANSFSFNRPIYVYNVYPYRAPSAYLLRG